MAETFREIVGKVMSHCPSAGPMLVRIWVEDGWLWLNDRRPWGHLRFQGSFRTSTAKTGTVDLTAGSPTVVPGTLTFAASDVGRQFRIGSSGQPVTIKALSGVNAVLDVPYPGDTATLTAQVLDAYITMPERFGRFITVVDPVNQWRLRLWETEQEISQRDPARSFTQDPWFLVNASYSPVVGLEGRVRYELWPYTVTSKRYDYLALYRPAPAVDTSYPDGVFRDRPDVVRLAALMKAAAWKDKRNEYFSLDLAARLERQLADALAPLEARDEEVYLTMLDNLGLDETREAPLDSAWRQAHDV
jgi:hypothetical protein